MRFCNITLMNKSNLKEYISPFLNQFIINDGAYELINSFVNVVKDDSIGEFWDIWWMFLEKILDNHENMALSNFLWVVVLNCDFFVQDIAFVPSYSHVS